MKVGALMFAAVVMINTVHAQLKTTTICPAFEVDILEGRVNALYSYSTIPEIKNIFPCSTSVLEETNGSTCGGIFYKDKDIYFFTERDYIEVGENFKGKLSLPLLGASRTSLFQWLGNPALKDAGWDAYSTQYGILILYYNATGIINKIQMSNRNAETIKLCE